MSDNDLTFIGVELISAGILRFFVLILLLYSLYPSSHGWLASSLPLLSVGGS